MIRTMAAVALALVVFGLCGNALAGTNPGPPGRSIGGNSNGLTDCPTCLDWVPGLGWISDGYIEEWTDTDDDGVVDTVELSICPRCNGSGRITSPSTRRVLPTYPRPQYGR